jgi:hypothetical protein
MDKPSVQGRLLASEYMDSQVIICSLPRHVASGNKVAVGEQVEVVGHDGCDVLGQDKPADTNYLRSYGNNGLEVINDISVRFPAQ